MTNNDFDGFKKIIVMASNYYRREFDMPNAVLDFGFLRDLDIKDINWAYMEYMRTDDRKEFRNIPSAGEIRKLIRLKKSQPIPFKSLPPPKQRTKEGEIKLDKALIELAKKMGRFDLVKKYEERLEKRIK